MIVQKYLKKMKIIRSIINCYLRDILYALQKFKNQIIIPLITSKKSTLCTQLISYNKYTFVSINSGQQIFYKVKFQVNKQKTIVENILIKK